MVFVGAGAEYMAFPCNNVIVLMETPVMPEVVYPEGGVGFGVKEEESFGGGGVADWDRRAGAEGMPPSPPSPPLPPPTPTPLGPPPQIFLRGHTDTVTRLRLSHAGHLLASAQGDPLGAAGERLVLCGCVTLLRESEGCFFLGRRSKVLPVRRLASGKFTV